MEEHPLVDKDRASTMDLVAGVEISWDGRRTAMVDRMGTALLMLLARVPPHLGLLALALGCHLLLLLHTTTTVGRRMASMGVTKATTTTHGVRASLHRRMAHLDSTRDLAGILIIETGIPAIITEEGETADDAWKCGSEPAMDDA